jgi:hypothetical protein
MEMVKAALNTLTLLSALLLLVCATSCFERFQQKNAADSHAGETAAEHAAHSEGHAGETAEEHAAHSEGHAGETPEEHAAHSEDGDHEGHDHTEGDGHGHEGEGK